ncbi:MAG: DUF3137 domain-containing protein [Pontixanthobacter sp.]
MIGNLDADALMAGPLGQWLEGQKAEREIASAASNKRFVMAGAGLGGLALAMLAVGFLNIGFGGFIFAALTMFACVWAYKPRAAAIQRVKIGINEAIAEAVGISYTHQGDPEPGFTRGREFKMLPSHDHRNFEDFWSGDASGHTFKFYEAHLQEDQSDSDGGSKKVTVFRGLIMTLAFGRGFHGSTLIQRAGAHRKFFGGKKDEVKLAGRHMAAVDIVHPDFEDAFDVYSDDQVEARYLVHPTYVERMIEIEKAFDGAKLRALFCDGEITLIVESKKNLFESGGMDASKDREKLTATIGQFQSMTNLAESLNENSAR